MADVGDEMGESIKRVAGVCSRIIFGEWMRRHMEWMNLFNLSNQEEGIDGRVEPGNGLLITGMVNIGMRIKELSMSRDLSQEVLDKKINRCKTESSNYEMDIRMPTVDSLYALTLLF